MPSTPVGSTDLLFQAPPSPPGDDLYDDDMSGPTNGPRIPLGNGGQSADPATSGPSDLRMLKGARQAAAGMKISDDQIRAVLEDPQDVQPDPKQPHRTRLTRDGVTLTTGNDGMILRVTRRR